MSATGSLPFRHARDTAARPETAAREIFRIVTCAGCPGRRTPAHSRGLKSFGESYCARTSCPAHELERRLFWRCLHGPARLLAPLILLLQPGWFEADREFILHAMRARNLRAIEEEIRDFATDPRNRSWWRRHLRVRVSTKRLRREARRAFRPAPPP